MAADDFHGHERRIVILETQREDIFRRLKDLEEVPEAVQEVDKKLSDLLGRFGVFQWLMTAMTGGMLAIAFEVLKGGK